MRISPRLLFPLVCLIWLGVAWRYWGDMTGEDPAPSLPFVELDLSAALLPDTFSILGGYVDPFLGSQGLKREITVSSKPSGIGRQVPSGIRPVASRPPMLPEILFLGRVQGPDQRRTTALIQWNKSIMHVQPGDSLEEWYLQSIGRHVMVLTGPDTTIAISQNLLKHQP